MSPPTTHRLLQRQLRRSLAEAGISDLADHPAAEVVALLLAKVNDSYHRLDDEKRLLEHSLQITSDELVERNEHLRAELEKQEATQERLERVLELRTRAEAELNRTLFRLDEAQRIAGLGYWQWDPMANRGYWSDQTARMFGFSPGAPPPSREALRAIIHTDDLTALRASLLNASALKSTYEGHVRIYRPDGEERTLRVSGEATHGDTTTTRDGTGVPHIQGVCLDVTESIENTRALLQAKERAEEALLLKTSLLENMSHEFRTPLTSILGYAECLQEEVAAEQQSLVSAILRGGQRLFGTLNAILDLAQLDGGSYHLILGPVETTALARQALSEVRALAEQRQLELRLVADGETWALGDHSALTRVLANLVGNAVKFTPAGFVEVTVTPLGEHVSLRVTDTGVGIQPEFVPHLFEEFRQESTGFSRRHEGNGLGLAITRRIVDLMGGMISVESTPGTGSTFEVLLPASSAPTPGQRPRVHLGPEAGSPELRALLPAV